MNFKTGIRVLAVIVMIGLVLGAGLVIYSRFQKDGARSAVSRKPVRVVYVNLDRLVKYHPAWSVAVDLASGSGVVEAVRAVDSEIAAGRVTAREVLAPPSANAWKPKISRESVEADAVWSAVKSLDEWQDEQKSALNVRLISSRKLMTNVSASEIRKQSQDIEAAAVDKRREVEARYLIDRINGQIKVSALETAAAIQGFESEDIKQSLGRAKTQLAQLLAAYSSDITAIEQDSAKQITDVRAQAAERVDSDLMTYEIRQKRNINTRLATFRDEIVQEMGVFTGSPSSATLTLVGESPGGVSVSPGSKTISSAIVREVGTRIVPANVLSVTIGAARKESGVLRLRVREDMRRAVEQIAERRGERAVFRPIIGIPDRTSDFERALKEEAGVGMQ